MSPKIAKEYVRRIDRIHAFEGSSLLPGDRVIVLGEGMGTLSTTYLVKSSRGYSRKYDVNLDSGQELRSLTWYRVVLNH